MAVYKRNYQGYDGALTPAWRRFLVPARYGYARLAQSRFLVSFLALCMFYPVLCAMYIYASHNPTFVALLRIPGGQLPPVDGRFFYFFSVLQGTLSYLLAAFVSPGLITSDLANGALPLYFSRPFSRTQYLAGKAALMLGVLSLLTWIPGLVLFVIESTLSGWAWMQANLWMAAGLAAGLFVWIVMATLIGFALSALVKWRVAAGALVVGVLFAGAGFGAAINAVVRTSAGSAVDLSFVMRAVWSDLLRYDAGIYLPLGQAWLVLGAVAVVCVGILLRRIRPFEVIK